MIININFQVFFVLFSRRHHQPFCPRDVLVVGLAPFALDERCAVRVVQVPGSIGRKKERERYSATPNDKFSIILSHSLLNLGERKGSFFSGMLMTYWW